LALIALVLVLPAFTLRDLRTRAAAPDLPNLCGGSPCIQVGTFNIEWFGTDDMQKHKHRSQTVINQIAELIATTLDLEVVVLEEINSQSQEFAKLEEALGAHGYKLRSGLTGGEQRVVIAYDDEEVDLVGDVAELDVRSSFNLGGGCRSSGLRRPLMAQFRAGEFDFVLIGVHLKAQPGVSCPDKVRKEQAKDIIAKINEITDEKDVLVAGDFNAPSDHSSLSPLLVNTGFRDLTKPSRRANGSNSISYLEPPYEEVIDHIVVRLSDTTEWVNRSTFIYNPPAGQTQFKKYLKYISDHAPAWASFRTDAGD
jgi:endonuclease/exonuclease/phosphatase family metal-dependent hydrolase